jgi:type I restriction enzyme S subunit
MEEWKECRLGDILNFRRGYDLPKTKMVSGKIPVAGSNGIIGYHNEATPITPCITIGRSGNVGTPYIYKQCWAHNTVLYVDDFKGNDPYYLYYLLKTLPLASFGGGSAVPTLNRNHIHPIEVKYTPNLNIQKRIVSVLSSLDGKIQNNKQINSNLEEQAKALFKSWFIDFDPFKDGKFIDSELGMIPEGWKVVTIGEVTDNIKEKVGDRDSIKVLSPVTSGHLVLSEEYFSKQVFSSSIAKYIVVKHNDFAYNPARINIGSIGMNEFEFDGCVSPVYVVFRCQSGYEYFFDLYRRTSYFIEEVKKRAIGGVRQTLSYKDLSLIQLIYPPKKVVDAFNFIYISFIHGIHSNDVSNKKLEAIRDTLLPKLMSGEIDVK